MNPYYPGLLSDADRDEFRSLAERSTHEALTQHEVEQMGCYAADLLKEVQDLNVLHCLAVDHGTEVETMLQAQEDENFALLEQTGAELSRLASVVEGAGSPVAAARLAGFAEGVRMLQAIRSGRVRFERVPVWVDVMVAELGAHSMVPVQVTCDPGLATVSDERRLREVLSELIHYLGSRGRVVLNAKREDDEIVFAVGMEGGSVAASDLFEHFGMTVARKISRGLRGGLTRREVDGQARFELRIPHVTVTERV